MISENILRLKSSFYHGFISNLVQKSDMTPILIFEYYNIPVLAWVQYSFDLSPTRREALSLTPQRYKHTKKTKKTFLCPVPGNGNVETAILRAK